jgi:hypothetical protein
VQIQIDDTRLEGFLGGAIGGIIGGLVLFMIGFILSLWEIGVFIGIPLMFLGVITVFAGPLAVFFYIKEKCPYCQTIIRAFSTMKGITCRACKNRVIIRDKQLSKGG